MYPIWKCTETLGGVVAYDSGFLAWTAHDVYKISDIGLELRRWKIHFDMALSDVCGAPAISPDGSRWLLATTRGMMCPLGAIPACEDVVCAIDPCSVLTRTCVYNVETEAEQPHGLEGVRGALTYKGVLVFWGAFGLRVGTKSVTRVPVVNVWGMEHGLWYECETDTVVHSADGKSVHFADEKSAKSDEEDDISENVNSSKSVKSVVSINNGTTIDSNENDKGSAPPKVVGGVKHFWSSVASSSCDMDIATCGSTIMVIRDVVNQYVLVDDVFGGTFSTWGSEGCTNYRFFDSFLAPHALAVSKSRVVAGVLGGGCELVFYDERTRASQASVFCRISTKVFLLCLFVLFVFSIFFS